MAEITERYANKLEKLEADNHQHGQPLTEYEYISQVKQLVIEREKETHQLLYSRTGELFLAR